MTAISKLRNRSLDDLQIVKKGGMDSGTWIDEKLVLNLARWLDVEFEIWCDERIAELSRNGHVRLDGSLPSAELSEIKQQLAELKASHSAEMAEIKALIINKGGVLPKSEQNDKELTFFDTLKVYSSKEQILASKELI